MGGLSKKKKFFQFSCNYINLIPTWIQCYISVFYKKRRNRNVKILLQSELLGSINVGFNCCFYWPFTIQMCKNRIFVTGTNLTPHKIHKLSTSFFDRLVTNYITFSPLFKLIKVNFVAFATSLYGEPCNDKDGSVLKTKWFDRRAEINIYTCDHSHT